MRVSAVKFFDRLGHLFHMHLNIINKRVRSLNHLSGSCKASGTALCMAQGQVAIVTGASKGIGRYIAHSLAGEGTKLAVVALDTERLRTVSDELHHRGAEVLALRADVRREDEVGRMVDRVVSHFGHIAGRDLQGPAVPL